MIAMLLFFSKAKDLTLLRREFQLQNTVFAVSRPSLAAVSQSRQLGAGLGADCVN